jgi:hypothetical protein
MGKRRTLRAYEALNKDLIRERDEALARAKWLGERLNSKREQVTYLERRVERQATELRAAQDLAGLAEAGPILDRLGVSTVASAVVTLDGTPILEVTPSAIVTAGHGDERDVIDEVIVRGSDKGLDFEDPVDDELNPLLDEYPTIEDVAAALGAELFGRG